MKTITSIIAAFALTISAAHADSPAVGGDTNVVADDTPDCLAVFGGWSEMDGISVLEVDNVCESEAVLTCPLEEACRVDDGGYVDTMILAPGMGYVVYVPHESGDVSWQVDDAMGTIGYERAWGNDECGWIGCGCTATPGMSSGDLGWFAFALVGLVMLRRRRSAGEIG